MRILNVRFENLNSLTGEWQIDFTHPDYASDGIFAITGPTGAGKTTIMDAICLALYGSTPRLGKITKSGNEIMSRQTGRCFAEVTFETAKGRYRCHWSQQRAYKKPYGELQQARHEIADADTGKVLESKIAQVGDFIEKVAGMDFERFTRSMLLAQGGFAAFLQAPPSERAPILEQITGTEIYSRISRKVHERRAGELDKLDLLEAELKGIEILSEDEERYLQDSLKEKQNREAELVVKMKEREKTLSRLEGMAILEKELAELDHKQQDFEQRLQVFGPESIRLERSLRALRLEGDYRGLATLRELQENETRELQKDIATLPQKEKACAEALAARQYTEYRLNESRNRQQSEAEVIKKVRDLDSRLGEQKKQIAEKERAIVEAEEKTRSYRKLIEDGNGKLKKAYAALEAIQAYLIEFAADEALVANLSAIERAFKSFGDVESKRIKVLRERCAAAGQKDSALLAFTAKKADREKIRQSFEKNQSDLKELAEEISAILSGRDLSEWRNEADAFRERERLLVQTDEILERIDRDSLAMDSLKTNLETLNAGKDKILNELKVCTDQKNLLEKTAAALETQAALLNRIRDLEEERKRLEDGQPCPLCGAVEHPYAKGNIPVLNDTEAELRKTRNTLKMTADALIGLESGHARTTTEIRLTENDLAEKEKELATSEKQCTELLLKLGMEVPEPERAEKIAKELADVRMKLAETVKILASAEKKEKQEKSLQTAMEKVRRAFDHADNALQDARHNLEKTVLDQERLDKECDILEEEVKKARDAALADVEPFGFKELPSENLDILLNELKRHKDLWLIKVAEKTGQEKKIDELKAGVEKHEALRCSLDEDLATLRKDLDELKRDHASLIDFRRTLFGEKNADEEEKRLTEEIDKAGKVFEKAREDHGKIEREISALKERIASLQAGTDRRAEELMQAERHWEQRIQEAVFRDEADFLSSRLSEEERKRLGEKEQALLKEKTELDARRKDRLENLATERKRTPTDQSAEVLKELIRTGETELKQLRLDIGGMVKSLSDNENRRKNQQERLKNIDLQKRECARWDDLHQLIGSADGKKFRNFAQGLTFEMMIVYANSRLREMTDRYLLIHNEAQPLELNIIDNYQAGEIRSTKNLSGGESFIVSLALALGLSQMASRNVRVDSLFLDEGFGTLDEDALETALETLAGLRQDGKLIGVISHVAALKERIGTQIQVTPGTGGRSSLSGPGCRRI